ncbi:MAG: glycosyltransferase family 2 protein [Acidobacteriota bacterium]
MKRVTAIIPSWNGRHLLPFSLEALQRQDEDGMEVLVVDNGSSDGTEPWLHERFPGVRLLSLPVNTGFASAVNAGCAATRSHHVLVLNNDAAPEPAYVRTLADFLDARPRAGSCQGRVLRHQDPSRVDSLGIVLDPFLRAHQAGHGERDPGPVGSPRQVSGVSASAALYRRCALESVAGNQEPPEIFAAEFFAYYEDIDLALRLARARWTAYLVPGVSCEHVGSATGIDGSFIKTFRLGRNYHLYLARHLGLRPWLRLAPSLLAQSLARLAALPLHPWRNAALLAGELAALRRLPAALRTGSRPR